MDEDAKQTIAVFRFGVIADLVGEEGSPGERRNSSSRKNLLYDGTSPSRHGAP
jgi:hypothetical protein